MLSGRRIASNYLWLPGGWLRRPLLGFDAAGRIVRIEHLAGEADRSVATEFWAGVLVPLLWDGVAAGAPVPPASVTDEEVGVVECLRREQAATGASLHEVIGRVMERGLAAGWALPREAEAGACMQADARMGANEVPAGAERLFGCRCRLVQLSGLDYERMLLTPRSVAHVIG